MSAAPGSSGAADPGRGDGLGTYEWLQRGLGLLEGGHAAAAATVLERVAVDEPRSASVLEALGRAQFTAGRPGAAVKTFELLAEVAPDSDYARFGYGQSLRRVGRLPQAAEQLALAVAMRPQRTEYVEALARVRQLLAPRRGTSGGATPSDGPGVVPADDVDPGLVVVTREPRTGDTGTGDTGTGDTGTGDTGTGDTGTGDTGTGDTGTGDTGDETSPRGGSDPGEGTGRDDVDGDGRGRG